MNIESNIFRHINSNEFTQYIVPILLDKVDDNNI